MKRLNTILSICLFFLLSFSVNAQVGYASRADDYNTAVPTNDNCTPYDVDIEITDVDWNTTEPIPGNDDIIIIDAPGNNNTQRLDDGYHAVYISFVKPADFHVDNTNEPYICSVSANLSGVEDKPVVFIYESEPTDFVIPIYDAQGDLDGFRVFPKNPNVGGIGTTVGIAGRVGNVDGGATPCVEIEATERSCNLPDETYSYCLNLGGGKGNKIAQTQDIKAYPSPAQNNLFVEINDLDIKEVNMMSLYGQTVSDKVAIQYNVDKMQINTTQLESGIYLIILETANGRITKKVMIQKD